MCWFRIRLRQRLKGLTRLNRPPFLLGAFFCGFRAFLILLGYYPPDLARSFGPFVDLLLTRAGERKKPRLVAGRMCLITLQDFGCGGRI